MHDFHTNVIAQYELGGATGSVEGRLVRSFDNGDSTEGIVADDELKRVYVSEEEVAVWRYGAEPGDGSTRVAVDRATIAGGNITDNIKNPTIYYGRNGTGYLIVSSQGGSNFMVYRRGDNSLVGSFKIGAGAGVDGVSGQDGIDVTSFGLGPKFPSGLFVAQDHKNTDSGNGNSGNQNYKLVSWGRSRTHSARGFSSTQASTRAGSDSPLMGRARARPEHRASARRGPARMVEGSPPPPCGHGRPRRGAPGSRATGSRRCG